MEQPSPCWPGNIFISIMADFELFFLSFKDKLNKYAQTMGRGRKAIMLQPQAMIPVQNPQQVITASCPQHRAWFLNFWCILIFYLPLRQQNIQWHVNLKWTHYLLRPIFRNNRDLLYLFIAHSLHQNHVMTSWTWIKWYTNKPIYDGKYHYMHIAGEHNITYMYIYYM